MRTLQAGMIRSGSSAAKSFAGPLRQKMCRLEHRGIEGVRKKYNPPSEIALVGGSQSLDILCSLLIKESLQYQDFLFKSIAAQDEGHQCAGCAPIPITEWMDASKFVMKYCSALNDGQCLCLLRIKPLQ